MAFDYYLGWNIDSAVREIDDSIFDIASRFAPWVSAYLAGFNLGRLWEARAGAPPKGAGHKMSMGDDHQNWNADHDGEAFRAEPRLTATSEGPTPTLGHTSLDIDPDTKKPRFSRLR